MLLFLFALSSNVILHQKIKTTLGKHNFPTFIDQKLLRCSLNNNSFLSFLNIFSFHTVHIHIYTSFVNAGGNISFQILSYPVIQYSHHAFVIILLQFEVKVFFLHCYRENVYTYSVKNTFKKYLSLWVKIHVCSFFTDNHCVVCHFH